MSAESFTHSTDRCRHCGTHVTNRFRRVFGVNDDVAVPLFDLDADGNGTRDETLPTWIEPLLGRLGLERVDA